LKLGRYDYKIQEVMENHSPKGCYTTAYYGNMALNIDMLNKRGGELKNYSDQEFINRFDKITNLQIIEAENFDSTGGPDIDGIRGVGRRGAYISNLDEGDWVRYENVDLTNANQISWLVNGRNNNNYFEVKLDSIDGPRIAYLHTQPQDDTSTEEVLFRELVSPLLMDSATGVRTIYVVSGEGFGNANIDKFTIQNRSQSADTSYQSDSELVVRALGTGAKNSEGVVEYPVMKVFADGALVLETPVNEEYREYRAQIAQDSKSVEISYENDWEQDNTADRNLRIDYIDFQGQRFESESDKNFSVGSWNTSSGCAAGYKSSEWIHCPGSLTFRIVESGTLDRLTIRARGTGAKNAAGDLEYPLMEVYVNNEFAREWMVTGEMEDYQLDLPNIDLVELRYQNDFENDQGNDRNLNIDFVQVNSHVYQAESPDVFSVGSWTKGTGCDAGYKQKEWIDCPGMMRFKTSSVPKQTVDEIVLEAENFIDTGGEVIVAEQETKSGVLIREGYIRRFDPGDYVTYEINQSLSNFSSINLVLKQEITVE
jgi:hypothetical protein